MKKILRFILLLALIYIVCKWPDKIVHILEFGFMAIKNLIVSLMSSTPAA